MKSFFILTFIIFLGISASSCSTSPKTAYCLHPLVNGGMPFPLLETSTLHPDGSVTDKGVTLVGSMCISIDKREAEKAE